jgi:two-component system, NtrC family, sensor histidine kinase HydH
MPNGGQVALRARNDGAFVIIEVADSGPGIAKARLGRIFDLFYSTKPEGTGFGLWSARRNALANGGELTVHSRPGEGATFSLSLPRAMEPGEGAL